MEFRIEGLCKRYPNGVQALQDVSLNSRKIARRHRHLPAKKDEVRCVLGYLPQESGLYPKVSAQTHSRSVFPLVHVLTFFDKPNFRRWQLVTRPRPGNVQRR
jgi:hypothetical protein